jgi:hypothetical protein
MEEYKEKHYKSVAYICSLFLIFGLFIQFDNEVKDAMFDLLYDIIAVTTFTFAYLWLKRRIMLIGLVLYAISWNVDLLLNPLTMIQNHYLLELNLSSIGLVFTFSGVVCLIVGLIGKFEHDYLTKRIEIDLKVVVGLLLGLTGIVQLLVRTI